MIKKAKITIIIDTREQKPLDFAPFADEIATEIGTCWPGDYTIKGWEKSIAFERKSVSDLIGTMKSGYVGKASIRRYESRFDLELEELERHYDRAFIIIEPDDMSVMREIATRRGIPPDEIPPAISATDQITNALYRAAIPPSTLLSFVRALSVEYGCHVYLAVSRADAAREVVEIAKKYIASRRHIIHRGKIAKTEKPPESAPDPW